jgi:hypothetical protein
MAENAKVIKAVNSRAISAPRAISVTPWWVWTIAVLGAILLGAGGIIALVNPIMLVSPRAEMNDAVRIYAGYVAARDLGLALMLIAALGLRAKGVLSTILLLVAVIQFLDAGIDLQEGRYVIVPGVVVLGLLFSFGAARLSGFPFWRVGAWKVADRKDSYGG